MKKIAILAALALAGNSVSASAQPVRAYQAIPAPAKAVNVGKMTRVSAPVEDESQLFASGFPLLFAAIAVIGIVTVAIGGGDSNG